MTILQLWNGYTRKDVHAIFSPDTRFTRQAGTWGLQGIVRVPSRQGDWVFFVTFGQEQGDHVFDESITPDGVLSWQSQPSQRLNDPIIQEFLLHDDRANNVHLFLRADSKMPYIYLGKLGYLIHDSAREQPVHFQWQLLDWDERPVDLLKRIGLKLLDVNEVVSKPTPSITNSLTFVDAPTPAARIGVSTEQFRRTKAPDYAVRDAKNRHLGLLGEILVLQSERAKLSAAGRVDLASMVVHVSAVEGDSAGYDIRSFGLDGGVLYIEVKTTEGGLETGFFISANEVAFSTTSASTYALYRLFNFDTKMNTAKAYVLIGDLAGKIFLNPVLYRADIRTGCHPLLRAAGDAANLIDSQLPSR